MTHKMDDIDVGWSEDFDLESIFQDLERFQQDEVVRDALSQGVDLRSYAREIDGKLQSLISTSIPEFIMEAPATSELYEQISECDSILASMESVLQGFQADLGGISDEIKQLQTESAAMSLKLKNRKEVEQHFFRVLEKLIVPDSLILGICQGDVNDDYLVYVKELDEKIKFAREKEIMDGFFIAPSDTKAVREVEPQLEKLRLKAVAKVRAFLLAQIAALKKPKTNVQIMQQNVMLKYRYFVVFLKENAPAVAEEVRATYVETMSRILHTLFKSYYNSLIKLQVPGPSKDDIIAADQGQLQSLESNPASLYSSANQQSKGKLAQRENEMGEPDASPIIVHSKMERKSYHFEALFRSVQKHLMDSATSEFLFILDFFDAKNTDLFNQIFAKTLSLCLEHIENYLYGCNDVISLLLMIRTTQAHQLLMQRRRVASLDGYFDHVNMMLWPQFKKVFDVNLQSVQNPNLAKLGVNRLDLKPHYVSKRYAEFTSTIYAISTSLSTSDEMLPLNLAKLRESYAGLLDNLVQVAVQNRQHHRALNTKKGAVVFRINNINTVLECFHQSGHAWNGQDSRELEEILAQDTSSYVEEELMQSFGSFISFLKQQEENANATPAQALAVIQDFASNWKSGLDSLNTNANNYFTSSENARTILKKMFMQFRLYYTRFQSVIQQHPDQSMQTKMVSIHEIMQEMRLYSGNAGN